MALSMLLLASVKSFKVGVTLKNGNVNVEYSWILPRTFIEKRCHSPETGRGWQSFWGCSLSYEKVLTRSFQVQNKIQWTLNLQVSWGRRKPLTQFWSFQTHFPSVMRLRQLATFTAVEQFHLGFDFFDIQTYPSPQKKLQKEQFILIALLLWTKSAWCSISNS